MSNKEFGLYYPDGIFSTEDDIRRKLLEAIRLQEMMRQSKVLEPVRKMFVTGK